MSWYNRESERGAQNFGNAAGLLVGAALHAYVNWYAVLVGFVVSVALAGFWVWQGAKKAAASDRA